MDYPMDYPMVTPWLYPQKPMVKPQVTGIAASNPFQPIFRRCDAAASTSEASLALKSTEMGGDVS